MRCAEKVSYRGRKFTKMIAARVRRETGEPIHAYKCLRCHCWHIGHVPGWRRMREAA